MLILLCYLIAPMPMACYLCARGGGDSLLDPSSGAKAAQHWAEFLSSVGIAVIVGLPIVLYHNRVIEELGAVLMDLSGFMLLCATVALAVVFQRSSGESGSMFG